MAVVEEKKAADQPSQGPEQSAPAAETQVVQDAGDTQREDAETQVAEDTASVDGTSSKNATDAEMQAALDEALRTSSGVPGKDTQLVPASVPGTPSDMSADPAPQALPIEAFNWKDLALDSKHYCSNCKMPVEASPTQVVRKKGHQQMSCKMCHKVTTMLYKNLHLQSSGFKDLSQEQVTDFYLKAGKMAAHCHGLQWTKLKGLLQDKLVESDIHRRTAAIRGKFLPLSVWTKKGYDAASIEQKAEKQKSDLLLVIDYLFSGLTVRPFSFEHICLLGCR